MSHTIGIRNARTHCGGKVYYASRKDAQTMANVQTGKRHPRKNRQRHGRPEFLRVYHCDRCNGWHLTKREDWDE